MELVNFWLFTLLLRTYLHALLAAEVRAQALHSDVNLKAYGVFVTDMS